MAFNFPYFLEFIYFAAFFSFSPSLSLFSFVQVVLGESLSTYFVCLYLISKSFKFLCLKAIISCTVILTEGLLWPIMYVCIFVRGVIIEIAVVQQIVRWLIRQKARVQTPGQTSKQNTKSISSAISSQQISGKNSESK